LLLFFPPSMPLDNPPSCCVSLLPDDHRGNPPYNHQQVPPQFPREVVATLQPSSAVPPQRYRRAEAQPGSDTGARPIIQAIVPVCGPRPPWPWTTPFPKRARLAAAPDNRQP
jgi:hypothetical protein